MRCIFGSTVNVQTALCVYPKNENEIHLEFQSLSQGALRATSEGETLWHPSEGGSSGTRWTANRLPAGTPFPAFAANETDRRRILGETRAPQQESDRAASLKRRFIVTRRQMVVRQAIGLMRGVRICSGNRSRDIDSSEATDDERWRYSYARMSMVPIELNRRRFDDLGNFVGGSRRDDSYFTYKSFRK